MNLAEAIRIAVALERIADALERANPPMNEHYFVGVGEGGRICNTCGYGKHHPSHKATA